MVELADAVGRHVVVEVERHGHGVDGLAGFAAAERRTFPGLVRRFPALLFEIAENAAGETVLTTVVYDATLVGVDVFLGEKLLLDAG